jgi:hypothetical protein
LKRWLVYVNFKGLCECSLTAIFLKKNSGYMSRKKGLFQLREWGRLWGPVSVKDVILIPFISDWRSVGHVMLRPIRSGKVS